MLKIKNQAGPVWSYRGSSNLRLIPASGKLQVLLLSNRAKVNTRKVLSLHRNILFTHIAQAAHLKYYPSTILPSTRIAIKSQHLVQGDGLTDSFDNLQHWRF